MQEIFVGQINAKKKKRVEVRHCGNCDENSSWVGMGAGKAPGEVTFELHLQVWWHWVGRMQRRPWWSASVCCVLQHAGVQTGPFPWSVPSSPESNKEDNLRSPST